MGRQPPLVDASASGDGGAFDHPAARPHRCWTGPSRSVSMACRSTGDSASAPPPCRVKLPSAATASPQRGTQLLSAAARAGSASGSTQPASAITSPRVRSAAAQVHGLQYSSSAKAIVVCLCSLRRGGPVTRPPRRYRSRSPRVRWRRASSSVRGVSGYTQSRSHARRGCAGGGFRRQGRGLTPEDLRRRLDDQAARDDQPGEVGGHRSRTALLFAISGSSRQGRLLRGSPLASRVLGPAASASTHWAIALAAIIASFGMFGFDMALIPTRRDPSRPGRGLPPRQHGAADHVIRGGRRRRRRSDAAKPIRTPAAVGPADDRAEPGEPQRRDCARPNPHGGPAAQAATVAIVRRVTTAVVSVSTLLLGCFA